MNETEIRKIIEADMSGLFELGIEDMDRESELYCQIKSSYKQGDTKRLKDLNSYLENGEFSFPLRLISNIRLGIRTDKLNVEKWTTLAEQISNDSVWKGEIFFSIAYALDFQKKFFEAGQLYKRAYKLLKKNDCPKKALLALHNAIVVHGNRYPDKRQFSDYHELLKRAKKLNCSKVTGLASLNLSIEYQKSGANRPALEKIEEALRAFENEIESTQYYLALGQKCDLLIDIGRLAEAQRIIQRLKAGNHKFSIGAVYNLEQRIAKEKGAEKAGEKTATGIIFSPTFAQRREEMKNSQKSVKLGKLESKLVDFLTDGPKDKISIIQHLYGENEDFFSLEGRLKSLLNRLRKKIPYKISYYDGFYSIDGELRFEKKAE